MVALVDEVVHCKGVQQPCPHASLLHIFSVFNILYITALAITLDVNIEHLLDGICVVAESFHGKLLAGLVER